MNTASSIPAEISEGLSANGLIQEKLGSIEFGPALPEITLIRATTEKRAKVKISAASRPTWVRAESSIPRSTIQVISTIQATPTAVTAAVDSAAAVQPKSSNE